jgi:3',5'-cyclic AMP phosphodiesterase CpdA
MNGPLTLAHLSDIHLPPARPYRGHIRLKRMLGVLNWYRRRSQQHLTPTLAAIVADMRSQAPDHIAVTGDLVNLGLPEEHEAARHWLAALGPPSRVTAIPGNHDIYVDVAADQGVGRWRAFMSGDEPSAAKEPFPFVRRLGRVALIGLNSAVPTPLFHAHGRLGPGQLQRLGEILADLGAQKLVRVVLIHHPPLPGQAPMRAALQDAEELAQVLAQHGAELVLHGHNHRAMTTFAPGATRAVPVIGVPSASLGLTHGSQTLARYNLYRITPDPEAAIELIERGLAEPGGAVVEIRRRMLLAVDATLA